ncbi:hypothetical protein GUJ93_ZPchr0012g19706 [Zizania palustris]|uniref:Uncharacterized protein n=1 Tax=Zizania palustris TaxID=103762 RepID=A0A8J6BNS8_ZIZPA|nr:hypothetical protein GUJ93_ZPchr0012g19706 [Zizania palustris]
MGNFFRKTSGRLHVDSEFLKIGWRPGGEELSHSCYIRYSDTTHLGGSTRSASLRASPPHSSPSPPSREHEQAAELPEVSWAWLWRNWIGGGVVVD